jgi:3-deoxy-D-manno-octulosonic acid (KDO) 8-phosphate synthase
MCNSFRFRRTWKKEYELHRSLLNDLNDHSQERAIKSETVDVIHHRKALCHQYDLVVAFIPSESQCTPNDKCFRTP